MQTVGWGKQRFKNVLIHVTHNSINIETFTEEIILVHSTHKSINHSFLHLC